MEKYYLKKKKKISNKELLITTFLAHGGSNVISKFFVAPLERVLLIKQTQPQLFRSIFITPSSFSFKNITKSILANQGVKSFWWGYQPRILKLLFFSFFRLLFYETLKQKVKTKDNKETSSTVFFSLYLSSCLAITLTYPLDVAQAYLALNFEKTKHKKKYSRGIFLFLYSQISKRTIRNLYCGYTVCLLNFFPYLFISIKLNEFFTKRFIEPQIEFCLQSLDCEERNKSTLHKKVEPNNDRYLQNLDNEYKKLFSNTPQIYSYIFWGVLTGYIAQTITYPIETIRRTYQYKKLFEQNYQNSILSYQKLQNRNIHNMYNIHNTFICKTRTNWNIGLHKKGKTTKVLFSSISNYYRGFLLHSVKLIPEYIIFSCFFYYVKNNIPV